MEPLQTYRGLKYIKYNGRIVEKYDYLMLAIKKVIELAETNLSIVIEQIYSLSVVFFWRQ